MSEGRRGDKDRGDRGGRGDRGDRGDREDRGDRGGRRRDGGGGGGGRRRRGFGGKKRPCKDCDFVDFKDLATLSRYCTHAGKIQSRKRNHTCSKCQGLIKAAVKRARFMGLMPYVG